MLIRERAREETYVQLEGKTAIVTGGGQGLGQSRIGGEATQGLGGVGGAVVEAPQTHRLAQRFDRIKRDAHTHDAGGHLWRETRDQRRRDVHRDHHGDVGLDRADGGRKVEHRERGRDLGSGLLRASGAGKPMSEQRQDIKAWIGGDVGAHPLSLLCAVWRTDNETVAIRRRIAISCASPVSARFPPGVRFRP